MKKAVIASGGKQYLVAEGDSINVELVKDAKDTLTFDALLVIDADTAHVGKPLIDGAKVTAKVIERDLPSDKVTSIRYKPKKRVRKVRGHRQRYTTIQVTKIA